MKKRTFIQGQLQLDEAKEITPKRNYSHYINERVEAYGVDSLIDAEILSMLTNISVEKLKQAIDDFSLIEIGKYIEALKVTKAQRKKLELLILYHKRMLLATYKEKPVLDSSSKAGNYVINLFVNKAYEAFYLICLDSQNRVNYAALVHEGSINESPVYPRIIVETALMYRANSVILSHNHPGGSLKPSSSDLTATRKLKEALATVDIHLVDHVIVAGSQFISLAEQGLV
jgi:DNA repair protein RadC